jgi:hypothetical protein
VIRAHRSLLIRFLRDPSRELAHALTGLEHAALHLLPFAAALCALAAALLAARVVVARLRERRLAAGARVIELAVPPELDSDGALLLWSALHDLLRPRLARLIAGQPQIAWEIFADAGGSRFRVWVPAAVPSGLVERALASAWPGITTSDSNDRAAADAKTAVSESEAA